jgi:hypothetical protein
MGNTFDLKSWQGVGGREETWNISIDSGAANLTRTPKK